MLRGSVLHRSQYIISTCRLSHSLMQLMAGHGLCSEIYRRYQLTVYPVFPPNACSWAGPADLRLILAISLSCVFCFVICSGSCCILVGGKDLLMICQRVEMTCDTCHSPYNNQVYIQACTHSCISRIRSIIATINILIISGCMYFNGVQHG